VTGPRRFLVPLGCLAFTALGVLIIVGGEPVLGGAIVLFFGLGAVSLLPAVRRRRGPGEARSIVYDGEPALLFPLGKGRQALAALGSAGLAAGSALLLVSGVLVGLLGAVFFGPVAVLLLSRINRPHGLVLTATRVVQDTLYRVEIPWEAVAGAGLVTMSGNEVLAVRALDPAQVRSGWFARFNRRFGPAEIMIPALQMSGSPEEALRTLELCLADRGARARLGST
jgi:hypothetical protein